MKKRWIVFVLAMIMLAAFAVGCNCNGNKDDSFDFKLLSSSVIIKKGESTRIKTNYSGEEPVIYVSGDETVVTVTEDGKALGKKEGSTTVTVTIKGVSKTCNVSVQDDGTLPELRFETIKDKTGENIVVGDSYTIRVKTFYKGAEVEGATYVFTTSNDKVLGVEDGVITGKSVGKATISVKASWQEFTVEDEAVFNVIENVEIDCGISEIILDTVSASSYKLEGVKVKKDGIMLNGITIKYETLDSSVATVDESGVISAIAHGETKIRVSCEINGATYNVYVSVTVKAKTLATPANMRVVNELGEEGDYEDEKFLVWDEVEDADYYEVTVERKTYTIKAGEDRVIDITESFGYTYMTVTAYSDYEGVEPSEPATLNVYYKTASFEKKAIAKKYYLDAKTITKQDYDGANVYYAECVNKDYSVLDYAFMKVYYTKNAQSFKSLWWLNGSLIDYTDDIVKYSDRVISMWVYANEAFTISSMKYIPDTRTRITNYEVPAEQWTKVSFPVKRSDCKFVVSIITSASFYYTDLRISDADYTGRNYADCNFFPGSGIEEELNAIEAKYGSNVATVDETAFAKIHRVDKLYAALSETRKQAISAKASYETYLKVKKAFNDKYVVIDDMTDVNEVLTYDNTTANGYRVNTNYSHPSMLSLSMNHRDSEYGYYLNLNVHQLDGSWSTKVGERVINWEHSAINYNLKEAPNLLADCNYVTFFIYNGCDKDRRVLANFGGSISDRYGNILLKAGEWTKVTVPKADFLKGNTLGIAWACRGEGNYDFKISAIFGVKFGNVDSFGKDIF